MDLLHRPVAGALIAAAVAAAVLAAAAPTTHRVTVSPTGAFSPATLRIRSGDTVEWTLSARTSAIVTAAGAPSATDACPTPRAFAAGDPDDFTGPLPFAPSGIFSLGPLEDRGLRVQTTPCPGGRSPVSVGGRYLCATGAPLTTMDDTWANPSNTGVFIRLLWNRLQVAPGTADSSFDFTDLDREIGQAVRYGKLYSLAIKAGNDGTPDWIFSTNANGRGRAGSGGGVTRLVLQDGGSGPDRRDARACGPRMSLGSPTDPMFEQRYFEMLSKVAAHIRARADWFRALAYVKPSGANLFSHENRLPKRCAPGCICNPQVFAAHGYTPAKLYDFYRRQFALLQKEFPGKAISYALIQDGFPVVNDSAGWETANGSSSNGRPLPAGTEQTEHILALGRNEFGALFVVQHNGLQPYQSGCANEGRHPATPPYTARGAGCPNRWVLRAGEDGRTITGFQTVNPGAVATPADVELALRNAFVNSDASFVELYEGPLWAAVNLNQGLLPDKKTIGQWADVFHERRRKMFDDRGDPFPKTYRHTFSGVTTTSLYYFDPSACRTGPAPVGTIVIDR